MLRVAAGVVLLVVLTAGAVVISRAARPAAVVLPQPSTSAPPRPASPPPTTSPSTPPGPDRSLQTNSLYQIDLGERRTTCDLRVRSPRPPLKSPALAPYLREVVDCLVKTFQKPLAAKGFTLVAPTVKTYAKTIKTPCGVYGQDKAPAFYCSATQTIYWAQTSDDGDEAYTYARLGYVGLMAHEFGHHLQAVTGMLVAYGREYHDTRNKPERYLLSRRLELQAQCFEGVFLNRASRSVKLSTYDRSQLRTWHGYTGDEDPPSHRLPDHGTSAAQNRWLQRGLDSADFGRCNTWKAARKLVK